MIVENCLRAVRSTALSLTGRRRRDHRMCGGRVGVGDSLRRLESLEERRLLSGGSLPAAMTLPASAITSSSAMLNASVNPNGSATSVAFQYSTNPYLTPAVTTVAGGSYHDPFFDLYGVAVDGSGNVYVADAGTDTIDKVAPSGAITIFAGSPGQPGSANGAGGAARFNGPWGLAIDEAGNLYVADTGNSTIRKITPSGVVTTLAGAPGQAGSADGVGSQARFNGARGVAVDHVGNLYVADTGNDTIRKIAPDGAVSTLAGTPGLPGSTDGVGSSARFRDPTGVAVDGAGNIYVGGNAQTIRKVTSEAVVTTLAGLDGQLGSADGLGSAARFTYVNALAVDGLGNIYAADLFNNSIREVTPSGLVTTLAVNLIRPEGVAADSAGNFYVSELERWRIQKVTLPTIMARTGLGGTSPASVAASLTRLLPDTTYYERTVATSSGGTTYGAIVSFTTKPQTGLDGPKVTAVQRFGYHAHRTLLVVTFDQRLDPSRAQDVAEYRLTGIRGRRPIRITSATYDKTTRRVTLRFTHLLPLKYTYLLTVTGTPPHGLTNVQGQLLDGSGHGHPGTNYSTVVTRRSLTF